MNQLINQITGRVLDEIVPYTWSKLSYDEIRAIQYRTVELVAKECALIAGIMEHEGRANIGAQILDTFNIKE